MIQILFFVFTFLVFDWSPISVLAQSSQSVPLPRNSDSCNVVQVNCGPGHTESLKEPAHRNPGPPGKMGPRGSIGPQGEKGDTGATGSKGEKGGDGDEMRMFRMMSATSCQELNEVYGVTVTGYYAIRSNETNVMLSEYCDFHVYEDVTSCEELFAAHGLSTFGFYRFPGNRGGSSMYHHCLDLSNVFTCHQLRHKNGHLPSGRYRLGLTNDSYTVWCDFSSIVSAVTVISHDSTAEVAIPACENHGCYSRIPRYELDVLHIEKIVEQSESCRQFIKYRCQGSVLLYNNNYYGWWVSKDGEKMKYWGGATSRRANYCACGETGQCVDNSYKCNCDNNEDDIITQDEGMLTDKTKLPVKEMRFGDMGGTDEHGWHTLGKLECMD